MSCGEAPAISKGFSNPSFESQAVFRVLLTAMSEPGRVLPCPALIQGAPLPPALAAVALALLDYETPLFLAGGLAREGPRAFLTFHSGAPIVAEPESASFVLALSAGDMPSIAQLDAGTPAYPDRSATVVVGVTGFEEGAAVTLRGPGIPGTSDFRAGGLEASFWEASISNNARFPLGVDFIFCGPDSLAALPRSSLPAIKVKGEGASTDFA